MKATVSGPGPPLRSAPRARSAPPARTRTSWPGSAPCTTSSTIRTVTPAGIWISSLPSRDAQLVVPVKTETGPQLPLVWSSQTAPAKSAGSAAASSATNANPASFRALMEPLGARLPGSAVPVYMTGIRRRRATAEGARPPLGRSASAPGPRSAARRAPAPSGTPTCTGRCVSRRRRGSGRSRGRGGWLLATVGTMRTPILVAAALILVTVPSRRASSRRRSRAASSRW